MDKYTKKIKAVKDLQEEYDHRREIEEQAFALLAEGKFKEAQELIDSLDDKKALEMLKEPIEEYGKKQICIEPVQKAKMCRHVTVICKCPMLFYKELKLFKQVRD